MADKERKRLLSKEQLRTLIQKENIKMGLLHQKTRKKCPIFHKLKLERQENRATRSKFLLLILLQLRP